VHSTARLAMISFHGFHRVYNTTTFGKIPSYVSYWLESCRSLAHFADCIFVLVSETKLGWEAMECPSISPAKGLAAPSNVILMQWNHQELLTRLKECCGLDNLSFDTG
jgi:hypothetical protein